MECKTPRKAQVFWKDKASISNNYQRMYCKSNKTQIIGFFLKTNILNPLKDLLNSSFTQLFPDISDILGSLLLGRRQTLQAGNYGPRQKAKRRQVKRTGAFTVEIGGISPSKKGYLMAASWGFMDRLIEVNNNMDICWNNRN